MSVYIDTSVLVSIYYPELITPKLKTFLTNKKGLSTGMLSTVEFSSAINKKILMKELSKQNGLLILNRFQSDIKEGYYKVFSFSQDDLTVANSLFNDNLGTLSLRTVDAINIDMALREKCDLFITADIIQTKSAKNLGLEVKLFS